MLIIFPVFSLLILFAGSFGFSFIISFFFSLYSKLKFYRCMRQASDSFREHYDRLFKRSIDHVCIYLQELSAAWPTISGLALARKNI
jgi:hypothetical protein